MLDRVHLRNRSEMALATRHDLRVEAKVRLKPTANLEPHPTWLR